MERPTVCHLYGPVDFHKHYQAFGTFLHQQGVPFSSYIDNCLMNHPSSQLLHRSNLHAFWSSVGRSTSRVRVLSLLDPSFHWGNYLTHIEDSSLFNGHGVTYWSSGPCRTVFWPDNTQVATSVQLAHVSGHPASFVRTWLAQLDVVPPSAPISRTARHKTWRLLLSSVFHRAPGSWDLHVCSICRRCWCTEVSWQRQFSLSVRHTDLLRHHCEIQNGYLLRTIIVNMMWLLLWQKHFLRVVTGHKTFVRRHHC